MGLFGGRKSRATQNPLPQVEALLSEFGPNYARERGQFVAVSSFTQIGINGLRLRLTPSKDLVLAYSTEGVIAGFLDFAQDITQNMHADTVARILGSDPSLTDHPPVLLLLIAGLRHKHSEEGDQGFGNDTLQRFSLQGMATSSIALGLAIDRGETGIDLEIAGNGKAALFPSVPILNPPSGKRILIHHAYVVFSLAQIGWINELLNDTSAWTLRHWITPSLRIELRESEVGYEWIAEENRDENPADTLSPIPGASVAFEGSSLESALSSLIQNMLPILRDLPWQTIARHTFEEMAVISLDIEERRLTSLIGLLQGGASDEEIQRFGESSYEEWQGQ